jgi:hypothetical protein
MVQEQGEASVEVCEIQARAVSGLLKAQTVTLK